MHEQDPIDELFARGLRVAEEAPPPRVWTGIVRDRGGVHAALLQLKRRWGLVALLLLLGGATAFWGLTTGRPDKATAKLPVNGNTSAVQVAAHAPTVDERSAETTGTVGTTAPAEEPLTTAATTLPHGTYRSGDDGAAPELLEKPVTEARAKVHAYDAPEPSAPAPREQLTALGTSKASQPVTPEQFGPEVQDLASLTSGAGGALVAAMPRSTTSRIEVDSDHGSAPVSNSGSAAPAPITRSGQAEIRAWRLPPSLPLIAPPGPAQVRSGNFEVKSIGPRPGWWVAATLGAFHENRSWRGGDAQLRKALSNTETPHTVWSAGIVGGVEWRGGWGLSIGMEHSSARYDFRHLDRYRAANDSLVPFVVTFNGEVVDSHTDTLTTYSEETDRVSAVNSYSVLRVPLEGSWHRAWHRWHVGVRAGAALEFSTLRTGATLVSAPGGTRSVDVASLPDERHGTMVTGSLAADLGYALTDRLALWATPTYTTGLLPLPGRNKSLYADPDRLGVRFRLAYTIQPR